MPIRITKDDNGTSGQDNFPGDNRRGGGGGGGGAGQPRSPATRPVATAARAKTRTRTDYASCPRKALGCSVERRYGTPDAPREARSCSRAVHVCPRRLQGKGQE